MRSKCIINVVIWFCVYITMQKWVQHELTWFNNFSVVFLLKLVNYSEGYCRPSQAIQHCQGHSLKYTYFPHRTHERWVKPLTSLGKFKLNVRIITHNTLHIQTSSKHKVYKYLCTLLTKLLHIVVAYLSAKESCNVAAWHQPAYTYPPLVVVWHSLRISAAVPSRRPCRGCQACWPGLRPALKSCHSLASRS